MLKHSMAAAGLLILATGAAMAQTVVITPEQETIVREYVVRQHVEPIPRPRISTSRSAPSFPTWSR